MPAVAFNCVVGGDRTTSMPLDVELTQTLQTQPSTAVMKGSAVRRLTPRECERLQGFPDDYSLVPYRGKPAADGPRYKALGNSMAVPVMSWIGQRIAKVEALCAERLAA
jgi:DNA (cytosine-5)-methyltransferase 1